MRTRLILVIVSCLLGTGLSLLAQQGSWSDTVTIRRIERNDGNVLIGRIMNMDAREIMVLLNDQTRLVLPKHLIRSISALDDQSQTDQSAAAGVQTATYVLTSSALPMPKGSSSIQFNIAGMAIEAFPTERFSVGLISSWFSAPMFATAMYRMPLGDNLWLGAGGFVGWGGSLADRNFLAAPTLTLSMTSAAMNLSLTGGFGATSLAVETYATPSFSERSEMRQITTPRAYLALGASMKLARNVRLIVDAFMITASGSVLLPDGRWMRNDEYFYYEPERSFTRSFTTYSNIFIIPAIRWEYGSGSYWQFGFAGYKGNLLNLENNSDWSPLPIPVVQWVIGL